MRMIESGGYATVLANNDDRRWLSGLRRDPWIKHESQIEDQIAESLGLRVVCPEWIGALTDGAIWTSESNIDHPDNADCPVVGPGPVYWDEAYAVRSMIEELVRKGRCAVLICH